jgi:ribosome-binding protein aMBF1 (putative translation factor)
LILVGVMVGGCASQASEASRYNADITNANAECTGQQFKAAVKLVQCLDSTGRPVVFKDLPNLLRAYDIWNSARLSAATDYDNQVRSAKEKAGIVANSELDASRKKVNKTLTGLLPQPKTDAVSISQEADKAASQCAKDWTYLVVKYRCDLDARLPVLERRIPSGTSALHTFYNEELAIAEDYDQAVSRAIKAATAKFKEMTDPSKGAFQSQVQLALQNDVAVTARQQQEAADNAATLLMLLGAGLSAYNQGRGFDQPSHPPIATSCTTTHGITNCLSD